MKSTGVKEVRYTNALWTISRLIQWEKWSCMSWTSAMPPDNFHRNRKKNVNNLQRFCIASEHHGYRVASLYLTSVWGCALYHHESTESLQLRELSMQWTPSTGAYSKLFYPSPFLFIQGDQFFLGYNTGLFEIRSRIHHRLRPIESTLVRFSWDLLQFCAD